MSACSHGILAISMQLYKKGASIPSVITFLLASPWANFPVTILLFGFFGLILGFLLLPPFGGFLGLFLGVFVGGGRKWNEGATLKGLLYN